MLKQEALDQSSAGIPSVFKLSRMFGEIPPAQIDAAVPFIKYSCNTVCPASRPRILFPFFFFSPSVCSLQCSACLHLIDSGQKPEEGFVTERSSLFLSVSAAFSLQHLLNCMPYCAHHHLSTPALSAPHPACRTPRRMNSCALACTLACTLRLVTVTGTFFVIVISSAR